MKIVEKYLNAGIRNISLADTAGHATPDQVEKMFSAILEFDDNIKCACHFHNTYGLGLANVYAALNVGVKYFESSVAGLGGCPFTKIAGGNVCTEDRDWSKSHRAGPQSSRWCDPSLHCRLH